MGGSSSKSQTTKTEPWKGQQPFLRDLFETGRDIYRQGYGSEAYQGPRVAGFTPAMEQGLGMLQQSAYGSPVQGAMQNYLMGGMQNPYGQAGVGMEFGGVTPFGGGYGESSPAGGVGPPTQNFSGNPYLDQMFNQAASRAGEAFQEQTMPAIGAMFGGAGRSGSGIQQQMAENAQRQFGRDLQGMAANIYAPAYESAMNRDVQRRELGATIGGRAAAMAPQLQGMEQRNIQNMLTAGQITQGQAQSMIDANRQQFQEQQMAPWQGLGQYASIIQGMPGGYGTTTAPGGSSGGLFGALGGASAGAGLAQALGPAGAVGMANPYMAPLAIGGGLMGLF